MIYHGLLLFLNMLWKHYFYFSRGEKRAIIILLFLLLIIGGAYIYVRTRPVQIGQQDTAHQQEFDKFVSQLKEKETKEQLKPSKKNYSSTTKTRYPYQPKLKEGETVELNSADTSALKQIPGIGSGYANRIVKYRDILGGYHTMTQLKEVWGMDDYLYAKITPYLNLTQKHIRLKVNHADFKELNKHPYLNYKQAQVIVDIRERKGNIESIERLSLLEEFNEMDIARLKPYLSFD